MTKIKLTNSVDAGIASRGSCDPASVRSVEVDALVDTGATMMALPEDVVIALGVSTAASLPVRLADGSVRQCPVARDLRVEILGREMTCDALVMPAGTTPLVGQIQLERLDLLVDAKSKDLIVNPKSPDAPLLNLLRVA